MTQSPRDVWATKQQDKKKAYVSRMLELQKNQKGAWKIWTDVSSGCIEKEGQTHFPEVISSLKERIKVHNNFNPDLVKCSIQLSKLNLKHSYTK